MRVAVFSSRQYDRRFLDAANAAAGAAHQLRYIDAHLSAATAPLAANAAAVCAFVNDQLDRPALQQLAAQGVRLVALRSAGFNHVDLAAARELSLTVARVPAYSPHAVAEHTVALMLSLNRRIHRAYARVREGNFALDGLLGFDLHGRTVGIVGTGTIGIEVGRIMRGFGCRVLGSDPAPDPAFEAIGGSYVDLPALLAESDIVTLHCPLTPQTWHLIDTRAVGLMKKGVMLINTSRGAVIDTRAVIGGLKSGAIGHLGLDVYEEEGDLFFENLSDQMIHDDVFARLLTFPNVLITGHQAFFTADALTAIAETTIGNIGSFETCGRALHEVSVEKLA
jgi:D-lactate dehydrogenase